jgi:mono/diheme cytochrome c family protein
LVGAEVLVGVLAVSAAATMVTIQPAAARPPVLAAPPVRPAHFFTELGPSRVHVAVSLPAPGRQAYRVTVLDRDTGVPRADVQKVFLTFGPPPEAELPSERIELEPDPATGLWSTSGAYTPLVGTWELDITVRREGARDEEHAFDLDVLDAGSTELGPPPATGIAVPAPLAALWPLLPAGPAGWLPALAALLLLVALWPMRHAPITPLARGVATGVLLLALAAAGSRTLVEAANATPAGAPSPTVGTDLDHGRSIYLANCASCHGPDGLGNGPIRPLPAAGSLDAPVREASDAELAYRIGYGVAGTSMPAFAGQLIAEERADLIGYLRDQFGGR